MSPSSPPSDTRRQVARFAAIFAGGTLASRALGLVRDVVLAATIPAPARDAFFFAFRLPNMLRDMLGEGATNAAFVPVFSASRETNDPAAYQRLVAACFSAMILLLFAVTVAGVGLMPLVPGALRLLQPFTGSAMPDPEQLAQVVRLLQWTFPYLFLIGVAVFATGPLFVARHYVTPSWSPVLLNVALIAAALGLRDWFPDPAWALVAGVWIGGVAQLAVLYVAMGRVTGVWLPSFALGHPGIRRVFWLLGPVLLGQAVGEVNKLVDSFFAIMLGAGVVSALFFANRLIQLPLSVFGIAISVAILPELSRARARGDQAALRQTLRDGLAQTAFLVLPPMAALLTLHEPLVRLIFQYGAFDAAQTAQTATALWYYAWGLLAFSWVKIAVQGFYAHQDTRTPVVIAAVSMGANILLNFALVGPMGFRGLALATTLSFTMNFLLLIAVLAKREPGLIDAALVRGIGRLLIATAAAAAVYTGAHAGCAALVPGDSPAARALLALAPLALGGAAYLGTCALLRAPEVRILAAILRRRAKTAG